MTTPSFDTLGLTPSLLAAITQSGYTAPTPIQERAIPPALRGDDVIGCAATGTGKTAAFVLPMVQLLTGKTGARGLILAPTRELALQINEQVEKFGRASKIRGAILIGGVGMGAQISALRERREIIIATPGRLIDHLEQGTARLDGIEILVLDEADRMLDMGFKPQLTRILQRVPKKRQSMLFSATMAGEVSEFARQYLHQPVRVEVARSGTTAQRATQEVFQVEQTEKLAMLVALLEGGTESTLVFTRTKHRADKVAKQLERAGVASNRIHADRSQGQRVAALEAFRAGKIRVLVATDIAARGIDVANIGHVVNFDLPHVPEDYVHRIGRTARAAASGRASSLVSREELPLLKDIEKLLRAPVPRGTPPRDSPAFQKEVQSQQARQRDPGPRNHTPRASAPRASDPRGQHTPKRFSGGPRRSGHRR